MKFKTLGTILKKSKRAVILEREVGWSGNRRVVQQYISNGFAAYPVYGLPRLDKVMLLTIMDIPADQWCDWWVSIKDVPSSMNFTDIDEQEERLTDFYGEITVNGTPLRPVGTAHNGLVLVNPEFIKPLEDVAKNGIETYIRYTPDNSPYLAVKSGLLVQAIIMPVSVTKSLYENLRELTARCLTQLMTGELPNRGIIDMDQLGAPEEQGEEEGAENG